MTESPRKHRKRWFILLLLLIVMIGLAVGWWLIHRGGGEQENASDGGQSRGGGATSVAAIAASREDFPVYLSALGTVTSLHRVEIRPRVEGELLSVNFREGDRVEKGDVLARIDPRTYQAQLDQAKGQLEQDLAQLKTARQNLERYQKLIKTNYVSRQDLEEQQQLVEQYQGTVAADRANVQDARVQLDYTTIEAPVSGRIGIRNVDPGNIIQLGDEDPIATLTQLSPISVIFSMPSQYRAPIQQQFDSDGSLTVQALDSDETTVLARGQLTSINSHVDTATGTVRMRAGFDNGDLTLFPSAFVNVRLKLRTIADTIVIPLTAIQNSDQGNFVYVVSDDGKVSRNAIEVAASDDLHAAVSSGVEAGQQVVVDGVDRLRDGASVKVVSHTLPGESDSDVTADSNHGQGDAPDAGSNPEQTGHSANS
ncbi:multidrug efflux system membrane fusion protein [Kushneria sinocarnis]|uniref:Multidrug efflux system membrane fusion protein n=1 Tax=Kushneria sinocarnis TaxID=595502 RepID=A0A420WVR2_9GAMM|nr:efflux RND transporter periplasmic adaptor subunit [Kushneria sinocarnis]RKR02639.1 multidrug efflux system membrane fusion protein [Kushneria sinocarnis]